MLSDITPSSFALAAINDDVKRLTKIPGVGNKTAQRLILELKDKLKKENISNDENELYNVKENIIDSDAVTALQVLGYSKKEIETVLQKIDINGLNTEEIIKLALQNLGR